MIVSPAADLLYSPSQYVGNVGKDVEWNWGLRQVEVADRKELMETGTVPLPVPGLRPAHRSAPHCRWATLLRPSCLPSSGARPLLVSPADPASFMLHAHAAHHIKASRPAAAKLTAIQSTPLFRKMNANPAALKAITKFAEVVQNQGFNTTAGPPSMFQMAKMWLNADVRAAGKELSDALLAAGVNPNDKEVMQQLSELTKLVSTPPPKI
ncbi:hypothetical protein HYPSUDRAFT_208877 [Hypholoma sublateritium FD-334 SS-4]|uniref:Uncharacterized protein n=1 Tax=Hypholoma sublateritium (strain FD-334 SS-4) TaxID=945553 RepID=A0A0D2P0S4_HYPSF|nr:hypothetical protein HYPSUDRAFT_208877 [Hypholoma sublateritium FD-334 SS-4]